MPSLLGVRENAFRTLGLSADATSAQIIARVNELKVLLTVAQLPSYPCDFPVFGQPLRTLEAITAASHRLEDPISRLVEEAVWFRFKNPIDLSASSALDNRHLDQARTIWGEAARQSPDREAGWHFQHNLAVLSLAAAEASVDSKVSSLQSWAKAASDWIPLLQDMAFWNQLATGSPAVEDLRSGADAPFRVRALVGKAISERLSEGAIDALRTDRMNDAERWCAAIKASKLPDEFLEPAREHVLDSVGKLLRARLNLAQSELQNSGGEVPRLVSVEDTLSDAKRVAQMFSPYTASRDSAFQTATELLAEAYQSLALQYSNQTQNSAKSLELVETAKSFATTEGLKVRLEQGERILHWNLALAEFEDAHQRMDYAVARRAFAVLERNCETNEENDTLEIFRGALDRLRLIQGGRPISKAPGLYTRNGIGTKIYGHADWDAPSETYVATLFFTFVYVPVLALGRYRVKDLGGNQLQFYSKVPLTRRQWAWNAAIMLALLLLVGFGASAGSTTTSSPVVRSVSSEPASSQDVVSRADIERRRGEIETSANMLEREAQDIEKEGQAIASLRAKLTKRRAQYPDGLPPDEYAKDEAEVSKHNARLKSLNVRIEGYKGRVERHKQDVAEFNALVERYNKGR